MKLKFKAKLAVIIPIKNESIAIKKVLEEIGELSNLGKNLKVILVDDGSSDAVSIEENPMIDFDLEILELRGSWGKESAMQAGLDICREDYEFICFMDGDGQHPFSKVLEMMQVLLENSDVDVVVASPDSRELVGKHAWARAILRRLVSVKGSLDSDFMIIRRSVAQDLTKYIEKSARLRDLVAQLNLRIKVVSYIPRKSFRPNKDSDSRWDLANLLVHASIAVVNSDKKVLKLIVLLGSFVSFISLIIFSSVAIASWLSDSRTGTASILLVMSLFFVFQLFLQILTFAYVRIVILEMKARPAYIVKNLRKFS